MPICVAPSMNATLPVGTPEPEEGVTMAVNVTDCPVTDGFTEEVTVVAVAVRPAASVTSTVCVPMVSVADWGALLVLAAAVYSTELLKTTGTSQAALLEAVIGQEVVTVIVPEPPDALRETSVWLSA